MTEQATRPCNYVVWAEEIIESKLREGGFPVLEDLEPSWAAEQLADRQAEDDFYGEAQDEYLASLSPHELRMLQIESQPVERFNFELKRNGKMVLKSTGFSQAEFESIPF